MLVQLPSHAASIFVVKDGPFSFPVNVMHNWRIFFFISICEAVKFFILKEAAYQEDNIRLKDNHPELIEEKVA